MEASVVNKIMISGQSGHQPGPYFPAIKCQIFLSRKSRTKEILKLLLATEHRTRIIWKMRAKNHWTEVLPVRPRKATATKKPNPRTIRTRPAKSTRKAISYGFALRDILGGHV